MEESLAPESREEAQCLLELARGDREVHVAEKAFIDQQVKAAALRVRLYRLRSSQAAQRILAAELEIGRIRCLLSQTGHRDLLNPTSNNRRHVRSTMRAASL
ncbi:hypothetical protein HGRIS_011162 [Hohenbuehelia grisea]|uniref:Uncharacterized protein n=1 Tax=Hohenbuehelia grisea TaxID=104357 RepID=A0ABR3IZ10_9AGAR